MIGAALGIFGPEAEEPGFMPPGEFAEVYRQLWHFRAAAPVGQARPNGSSEASEPTQRLLELGAAQMILHLGRVLRDVAAGKKTPPVSTVKETLTKAAARLAAARIALAEVPDSTRRWPLTPVLLAELPRALARAGGAAEDHDQAHQIAEALRHAVVVAGQPQGGIDLVTLLVDALETATARVVKELPSQMGTPPLAAGIKATIEGLACVWFALRGTAPTLVDNRESFLDFAVTFAPRFGRTITTAQATTETRRIKRVLDRHPGFLGPASQPPT